MTHRLPDEVSQLLRIKNLLPWGNWQTTSLSGDGSFRRFYRIRGADSTSLMVVLPPAAAVEAPPAAVGLAEARSAYLIGSHLYKKGVPVPKILGYEEKNGIIIFEDLGDNLLQQAIQRAAGPEWTRDRYRAVVDILVHMQFSGRQGFDPDWCWDTPRYDRELMLTRESGYFLQEFCIRYLDNNRLASGLDEEFQALAGQAAREPADFFLHRDFQSRNLLLQKEEIRIIDFQGGRLGPLGYDLAALLIDPYIGLTHQVQDELLSYYIKQVEPFGIKGQEFAAGYPFLVLQRNLQILGAFAHLSQVQGKPFFKQYIHPALVSLQERLANTAVADYPCLRKLCADCLRLLKTR
jgi:aminoglycoside/choline kinase family phosphotransferase